jgi:hypothetical protein
MDNLKAAAKSAFDHSPLLKVVFVTTDGTAFILETDAKWHAKDKKLEDSTVTPFTRDEANDVVTQEDQTALIAKINDAKTILDLHALVPVQDTRNEVDAAVRAKGDELHALEATTLEDSKQYWWNHIL